MTTGYYVDDKPLEDLVAKKSDALQQMITSSNFFTLPEYNLNGQFGSASPNYNGGTWGVTIDTGYYKEGSPIPFIDSKSVPNHYLVKKSDGTFVRQFPKSDWSNNYGTSGKFISGSDIDASGIEISYTDGMLLVKKGSTELINIKASPYILLDIQAPGGAGGGGASAVRTVFFNTGYAMAGGGGGGSGAFASLSCDLTYTDIIILDYPPNSDENNSVGYFKVSTTKSLNNALQINYGANGTEGEASVGILTAGLSQAPDPNATGGTGGNGGTVQLINSANNGIVDATPSGNSISDDAYIIDVKAGAKGANGSALLKRSQSNGLQGSAVNCSLKLSSVGCTAQCTLHNSTAQAIGGLGEIWDSTKPQYLCGGGGGGASLMSNGGSHGDSATAIGAGGWGGSSWGKGTDLNHTAEITPGGPGAMWIYYIPKGIIDITETVSCTLRANYDGSDQHFVAEIPFSQFTQKPIKILDIHSDYTLHTCPDHISSWEATSNSVIVHIERSRNLSEGQTINISISYQYYE